MAFGIRFQKAGDLRLANDSLSDTEHQVYQRILGEGRLNLVDQQEGDRSVGADRLLPSMNGWFSTR